MFKVIASLLLCVHVFSFCAANDKKRRGIVCWSVNENEVAFITRSLELGADPDKIESVGAEFKTTPLMHFAYQGFGELVKTLIFYNASVNARDRIWGKKNRTALHYAVMGRHRSYKRVGIVEYLLNAKASVNAQDLFGQTALHHILGNYMSNDHAYPIIALLMKFGIDVDIKDHDGMTAREGLEAKIELLEKNKINMEYIHCFKERLAFLGQLSSQ